MDIGCTAAGARAAAGLRAATGFFLAAGLDFFLAADLRAAGLDFLAADFFFFAAGFLAADFFALDFFFAGLRFFALAIYCLLSSFTTRRVRYAGKPFNTNCRLPQAAAPMLPPATATRAAANTRLP